MSGEGHGPHAGRQPVGIAWRAVAPSFAALVVAILPGFLAAALAVQIGDDIGMTLTDLGLVVGAFFGASALASPLAGNLVERIGWEKGLRLAALLAVPALGGSGLFADTPIGLVGFFVVGGVATALAQPATNLAVSRCVPLDRHGLLFGVKHVTIPITTLLGGLAVPLIGLTVGWRWAFGGAAVLAAVTALLIPRDGRPFEVAAAAPPPSSHQHGERALPDTRLWLLVLLAVASGFGIAANDAVASFIVVYGVETGFTPGAAGALLVFGSLGAIASRLVAGWAIDQAQNADLTLVAVLLAVGALGVGILALGTVPSLVAGVIGAFVAGWGWSGVLTFAVVSDNPSAPAAATGVTHTGVFIGAAVGPPAFGFLAESQSFQFAWALTAASMATAAVLVLYARFHLRGRGRQAPRGAEAGVTAPPGGEGP